MLVDDDDAFRNRMARALEARGFEVETAAGAAEAVAKCIPQRFAYAVIDLRMPDASGLELISTLKERDASVRILVLTGYGAVSSAVEAIRLGAWNFVSKPADADEVLNALERRPSLAPPARSAPGGTSPTLARAEWEHIQRILADCNGNISETSRRLAITRRTLQLKLKKGPE